MDQQIGYDEDSFSDKSLRELQHNDKDISLVRSWIENNRKPDANELSNAGGTVKSLWAQRQILVIEKDILYRTWKDQKGTTYQATVPVSERRQVLTYCHDDPTAGHLWIRKTLSKVRQSYYWPGLQRNVRHYMSACEKCLKSKNPVKTLKAPMHIVGAGRPMERIAADILGELPVTERGNRYILVVSDYFTKWTENFPIPTIEAETVANTIVKEVITRFGVPSTIHSDQGRQFESQLFAEMCKMLHIKKTRITPYHPQSNGMVERFNKTLVGMLQAYVNEH